MNLNFESILVIVALSALLFVFNWIMTNKKIKDNFYKFNTGEEKPRSFKNQTKKLVEDCVEYVLEDRIKELKKENVTQRQDISELKIEKENLFDQLTTVNKSLTYIKKNNDELVEKVDILRSENRGFKIKMKVLEGSIKTLTRENKTLMEELGEIKQLVTGVLDKNSSLETENQQLRETNTKVISLNKELKSEVGELRNALNKANIN